MSSVLVRQGFRHIYIYGVSIKYMETGREKREKKEVFGGSDSSGKRGGLVRIPIMIFGAMSPQSTQEKSGQFRYNIWKLTVLYYYVVFSLLSIDVIRFVQ